jgi:hypothetical protein
VRVGSIEPSGQPSAQSNGGHIEGNFNAQNPAYRQASHFYLGIKPLKNAPWSAFFLSSAQG